MYLANEENLQLLGHLLKIKHFFIVSVMAMVFEHAEVSPELGTSCLTVTWHNQVSENFVNKGESSSKLKL